MKTPDAIREQIAYDPLCRQCREDAERPNAGVTLLCAAHLVVENDSLRARLAASEQKVAALEQERDAIAAEVLAHRELFAAVDEWIDARDRLASLPCRPGSMGYTFTANQVERGVARIDAAYAVMPLPPPARAGVDRPGVQRATAV